MVVKTKFTVEWYHKSDIDTPKGQAKRHCCETFNIFDARKVASRMITDNAFDVKIIHIATGEVIDQ